LKKAAFRVSAIARAHQRIHEATHPDRLDLGSYVKDVCHDVNEAVPRSHIEVAAEPSINTKPDRAVSIALIVNELITNAAKYAYQDDQRGGIWVRIARSADDTIELSVHDEGRAPSEFRVGLRAGARDADRPSAFAAPRPNWERNRTNGAF
jgi:two-component sensor histidine kinase